mmetsp:Transcript_10733/g.23072  ORF Transcript_10733/g.23072 Transcript_10733/m.23072 type:complete len:120 (-) Transcript_10733:2314-2673(-)
MVLVYLDATPDYMLVPSAACRIRAAFPAAKLMLLLKVTMQPPIGQACQPDKFNTSTVSKHLKTALTHTPIYAQLHTTSHHVYTSHPPCLLPHRTTFTPSPPGAPTSTPHSQSIVVQAPP